MFKGRVGVGLRITKRRSGVGLRLPKSGRT
jgi:hypothetical protein